MGSSSTKIVPIPLSQPPLRRSSGSFRRDYRERSQREHAALRSPQTAIAKSKNQIRLWFSRR